jgi:hypothetical protein
MGCAAVSLHRHPQGLIGIHIFFYGRSVTGSRHKCGHNGAIILIYLDFLCIKLPCAMVLRLIRDLPGVPGLIAPVAGGSSSAGLIPASGDQDHATSPSATGFIRHVNPARPSHPALHVW